MKQCIIAALFLSLFVLGLAPQNGGWPIEDQQHVSQQALCDDEPSVPASFPGREWTWAESPDALGWSLDGLARAQDFSQQIGSAAVMIVDNGLVIDAWGDITRNYPCHSMRKSLISALYGIYVSRGLIDMTATLADLEIDDIVPLTETEKTATVADLLKARSGVYIRASGESPGMAAMRPERGSHAPGSYWYYNNWDFNTLGTIFDQETGEESIYQAFQTAIAEPIGMEDYRPEELGYTSVDYSLHPYYGFNMSARDLARFGLLFLRGGYWEEAQIIASDWVVESTASHSERGLDSGYGYMWWTGTRGGLFPNVTVADHSYYASGWGGHNVIVLPYRNLVVVHRVNTFEPQNMVSEHEVGALLWLILDAAGEEGIGQLQFMDHESSSPLDSKTLRETVSGNTLYAQQGPPIGVALKKNQTLHMLVDGVPAITGSWYVANDMLITDIPGTDAGGSFFAFLDDDIIRFYEPSGLPSKQFQIVQGLPENL